MRLPFFLIALFISTLSFAATLPTAPTLAVGGQVMSGNSTVDQQFTGSGSLITLNAGVTGANRYSGLIKIGATTAYTPSGSKKFVSVGALLISSTATSTPFYFSSCDTALTSAESGTAPVNPVYLGSGASGTINAELGFVSPTAAGTATTLSGPILTIPNGKFGCADNGGTGAATAFVYGYEQ